MKRKILVIAISAVLLATLFLFGCQASSTSPGNTSNQQQGVWVSGQGKVSVTPDLATASLGIQAQAAAVNDAQAQATAAMNNVMAALAANGIATKDIQTSYYNIQKVTRWNSTTNQEETTGYMVTNPVNVKIHNIDNAGTILDAVVAAGGDATRINNISFTVEDPLPYYDQAREKAMAYAKDRAESLAKLAGVTLGNLTYVTENTGSVTPIYMSVGKTAMDSSTSTPISAGELDIEINVQAAYAIK